MILIKNKRDRSNYGEDFLNTFDEQIEKEITTIIDDDRVTSLPSFKVIQDEDSAVYDFRYPLITKGKILSFFK